MRKFEVETQFEYLPGYPDWETELQKRLDEHSEQIVKYAWIVHDKDTDASGNPIKPHLHLMGVCNNSYKISTIAGFFGISVNFVQRIKSKKKAGKRQIADFDYALSYLTHQNAPDKYQYDDSAVHASPGFDWITARNNGYANHQKMQEFGTVLDLIDQGVIKRHNLFEFISQQDYIDHSSEIQKAFDYQEGKLMQKHNRDISCIFITGPAGCCKTTYAKEWCEQQNLSYAISGSNRDPLQNYKGQDVLILDDLRPDTFSPAELLKLLDNNTASAVGSRYNDKFLTVKFIIITSVIHIDAFFLGTTEPIEQLKRRCQVFIDMNCETLFIHRYSEKDHSYILEQQLPNKIYTRYSNAPSFTMEKFQNIVDGFDIDSFGGKQLSLEALPYD